MKAKELTSSEPTSKKAYVIALLLLSLFSGVFFLTAGKQSQDVRSRAADDTVIIEDDNTALALSLKLHGLGNGGDNSNASSAGNFTLIHPQRTVEMQVFDVQNQLVATQSGMVTFDPTAGIFTGTIDMGTLPSGSYSIKIKTDQFLRNIFPGIPTIIAAQTNQLPEIALITGDVNNDNALNILDYNILMGCYSDLQPAESCTSANQVLSDLNDDGAVNQVDYNLFIREMSNMQGQ